MTIDKVKQGKRNRRHGHDTERMVARYLKSVGYTDAETTRKRLGSDGAKQPGDISFHPLVVVEVKSVAGSSSWPSWCRQANAAADVGQIPVVVRRTRGVTDVGRWPARLPVGFVAGCKFTPMAGLREMWVQTNFASVVLAVARMDGRTDVAELVHARLVAGCEA